MNFAHPLWREEIKHFGQERANRERAAGRVWTDGEVLEGLLLAILSQQVAWTRIERARESFPQVFDKYSIDALASRDGDALHGDPRERKLGSQQLRRICQALPDTARTLMEIRDRHGSLSNWQAAYEKDPVAFIRSIARYASPSKLKMVGVAIACEFLKNVGFAEFKPDVHLCRLFSCNRLGLVPYMANPEQPTDEERLAVRLVGLEWAAAVGWSPVVLDNALWMFCARGYGAICGKQPNCVSCSLAGTPCAAPNVHRLA